MAKTDFFTGILGNAARAKILRFLFAAPGECRTADEIAAHSQVQRAAVTRELKALQKLGIVRDTPCERESTAKSAKGKEGAPSMKRVPGWAVDTLAEQYRALAAFIRETEPSAQDSIMEKLKGIGRTKLVIASGCFVEEERGPSRLDLLIVGDRINERKVSTALRAAEAQHGREIAYAVFTSDEFKYRYDIRDRLIRDVLDYPHQILVDKLGII